MSEETLKEVDKKYIFNELKELNQRIEAIEKAYRDADNSKPKKIDMSKLVGSDIDCEFDYNQKGQSWISQIVEIRNKQFMDTQGNFASWCRVRENHWHYWDGSECPLPDGLKIRVKLRMGTTIIDTPEKFEWKHTNETHDDIIAFQVLGCAEGWEY